MEVDVVDVVVVVVGVGRLMGGALMVVIVRTGMW